MINRLKYYFNVAWKKYHFIIPLSEIKRYFKNHIGKKYYVFKASSYNKWLKKYYDPFNKEELSYKPLISVIIPVYNVKRKYLVKCIDSVLKQSYEKFEICIVDDASTLKETLDTLNEYQNNKKIKIKHHSKNIHISISSNDAVSMAKGEFIVLLDNDDFIDENALYEVVKCINHNPKVDLIYSDEDKVNASGKFFHTPYLKPDFSPDYLLNFNYICHLVTIRKTIFNKVNGFRKGYEGVQDWDLLLRITEVTNNICHIPRILYHWRELSSSTALSVKSKPYVIERTKLLIEDTLQRRNINAKVTIRDNNVCLIEYQNKKPKVSMIIISDNKKFINNIFLNTHYSNYEIIVITNQNMDTVQRKHQNFVVINYQDFNKSKLINMASKKAQGEYLIIISHEFDIKNKEWVNMLIGHAQKNHVGSVGCNYELSNKLIKHGNIIYNPDTIETNCYEKLDSSFGIYTKLAICHNVMAIKDTCMMIKKDKFNEINGYDENIKNNYNDVDFGIRLYQKGYYNVLEPNLVHVLLNDKSEDNESDQKVFRNKWSSLYPNDPFYNINLDKHKAYYFACYTNNPIKHVFIIGSRGYDYSYGGWETFVKNLVDYYPSKKVIFHISGIDNKEIHTKINNNVFLDLFPLSKTGKMKMYMHTIKATKYYKKYVKNNNIRNSIFYILGLKLGGYLKWHHRKLNKMGIQVHVNPDGLEWKRAKYGIIGKSYFLLTEKMMLNHCDMIISDAKGIYEYIVNKYPRNKIPKKVITYGTNKFDNYMTEKDLLKKFNLKKDDYLLVVGRLVPENNLSLIIKEFMTSKISKKLVIVTNESITYFDNWCQKENIILNNDIIYLGPVYAKKEIFSLRYYAWAYIHGHSVGGTNPSLLESLYTTSLVIAYDVCFNKDICQDSALYFSSQEGSLKEILNDYKKIDKKKDVLHKKALELIEQNHTWEYITKEYQKIWGDV